MRLKSMRVPSMKLSHMQMSTLSFYFSLSIFLIAHFLFVSVCLCARARARDRVSWAVASWLLRHCRLLRCRFNHFALFRFPKGDWLRSTVHQTSPSICISHWNEFCFCSTSFDRIDALVWQAMPLNVNWIDCCRYDSLMLEFDSTCRCLCVWVCDNEKRCWLFSDWLIYNANAIYFRFFFFSVWNSRFDWNDSSTSSYGEKMKILDWLLSTRVNKWINWNK